VSSRLLKISVSVKLNSSIAALAIPLRGNITPSAQAIEKAANRNCGGAFKRFQEFSGARPIFDKYRMR
jgi:hypothetical protein